MDWSGVSRTLETHAKAVAAPTASMAESSPGCLSFPDLQGRQAQCPSAVLNEGDQCRACALTPRVVIDPDLIDVQIERAGAEFVFGAIHDRAVDVADNCAVHFRYRDDAAGVTNECC